MVDVAPHEVQVPAVDEKGLKEVLDGIKVQRPASNTASGPEHRYKLLLGIRCVEI